MAKVKVRKLHLGRLAIYGAGVFSDLLAEVGAGFLKYAPVALKRALFVASFLVVGRFGIVTIVAVILAVVLASFLIHRKRTTKATRTVIVRKRRKRLQVGYHNPARG